MSRTKSRLAPRLEVSGFHERRNIMANILKRIYRIFNGTDWDIVHLETDSEQVKHDTTTVKAKLDALKSGALATVVNNLTTTATNTVLDGRQGKALDDKIKALNSALTVETRTVEGAYVNLQVTTYGKVGWIRISSYLKQSLEEGREYEMFKLGADLPRFMVYRRVYITNTIGYTVSFNTDGAIKITPFGGNIQKEMGFNLSEFYILA